MSNSSKLLLYLAVITACSAPDPSPSAWTQKSSLDVARSENPASAVDGSIYTMGGLVSTAQGMGAVASVERYEVEADLWEAVADLPAPRHHSMAVAHEGRIYHFGGMDNSGFNPVAHCWVFDPETGWSEIAPLPEPVGAGAAVVIDGLIYVVGGVPSGTHLWSYDPDSDSWSAGPPLSERREHIAAVAYDGKLWAIGGRWDAAMLDTVEIYDPATSIWSAGPSMLEPRSGFGAAVVGNQIFVAGGEVFSPTEALSTVEVLDGNSWIAGESLPYPLHGMPLVTVGDTVFVIGGSKKAADVDNPGDVWALRP